LIPPLWTIDFKDVPYDAKGREFIKYHKDLAFLSFAVMIFCGSLIMVVGGR